MNEPVKEPCICGRDFINVVGADCWICQAESARNGQSTADELRSLQQEADAMRRREFEEWQKWHEQTPDEFKSAQNLEPIRQPHRKHTRGIRRRNGA